MDEPRPSASASAGNTRGILAMIGATACFCCGDTLMKLVAETQPTGQCIFVRGITGATLLWLTVIATGRLHLLRAALNPAMGLRAVGDIGGAVFFQSALARMRFADAAAVLQIQPLMVTAAAALFLGEPVGWRRWTATAIGLVGVILIIQPGTSAFSWWSTLLLVSVSFATLRDLATRKIGADTPGLLIATLSTTAVMLVGLAISLIEVWTWPNRTQLLSLMIAGCFSLFGQVLLVASIRAGDVSAVVPFRYAAMVWALVMGFVVWRDIPGAWKIFGIAVVVSAGLYTFLRERTLANRAARSNLQISPVSIKA